MEKPRPHIEPGMQVEIIVKRLQEQISHHMTESDLGMQHLLEAAVERFINGGLQEQVKNAVNRELPNLVESIVRQTLWDTRGTIAEAVSDKLQAMFEARR